MRKIVAFLFCISFNFLSAQEKIEKPIFFNNIKVSQAFIVIEKEFNVKISYTDDIIVGKTIFLKKGNRSLDAVLDEISELLDLDFKKINNRFISVAKRKQVFANNTTKILDEVVIKSYITNGVNKNKDGSFKIKPKQLEILPGLIEADVLEILQELPGVISPNETATGLNVRGGTPDQNQIIWDGITMYHSGHFFGMISPFNPYISENVTFLNKGVTAKYGESISSVIDVSTTNSVAKKMNIGVGLNGLSVDAFIEAPIIKDKLSILVSHRNSYHKIYETGIFEKIEDKVFQSTDIHNAKNSDDIFYFKDNTIKVNYELNDKNKFSLSTIHIDNDLEHYFENINNKNNLYEDILDTENDGFNINWRKKWSENTLQKTEYSVSNFNLFYNFITLKNDEQISDFEKLNTIKSTTFSTEINTISATGNSTLFGFQSNFKDVSYSYIETTDVKYILDSNRDMLNTYSLYTNYINRNFSFFDFNLGARINYYSQLNQFRIEPRIVVFKNITDYLKLQLTADVRNQTVNQIDETLVSNLSLENKLWRLSNNTNAPIINSNQLSFGVIYQKNGWTLDFDAYSKQASNISALSLGFLSNNSTSFLVGNQKAYGVDFYLKKNFKHIKTWLSYSFSDINNKFSNLNNNEYFTANNQIKHFVSYSVAYKTEKVQVALGWKWHSGKPYTLIKENDSNNSFTFDSVNTETLPNYNRLDFSSVYNFSFSDKSQLKGKIGFSIRNLLDQKNTISKDYSGNNIPNEPLLSITKFSLSRTTNFVFRLEW
ncbi:MAG: TonB-dependent receptor plug domain-containing protein [Polaribacter sp.]|uniref:TonB-dependent receptor plug domain-containing protein n=1 Tax=Polaribacter sp. TaxID=1920175 RepID=UPI00321BE2E9